MATDNVGNTGTSTAVFSRRIDNTNPTVTIGSLAAWLDGTVTLTSTPADGGGIASVRYQYKLSTSGTWLTACTSATTPYSVLVQHDAADQRPHLRLPRDRHRQRRPHRHLRHGHARASTTSTRR